MFSLAHRWLVVANQSQWDLSKKFEPGRRDWWDTTTFRDVRVKDRVILLQVPGAKGNVEERGLFGTGIVVSIKKPRYTRVGSSKSRIIVEYSRRLRPFVPLTRDSVVRAVKILRRVNHGTLRALLLAEPVQTQAFVKISQRNLALLNRAVRIITRKPASPYDRRSSRSGGNQLEQALSLLKGPTRTEVLRQVAARIGQEVVRKNAIMNYPHGCALCRIPITETELLTASHIKPWSMSTRKERMDPANVILLCALHDRLFENGFVDIDKQFRVKMTRRLRGRAEALIEKLTARQLKGWIRVPPGKKYLSFRRTLWLDRG